MTVFWDIAPCDRPDDGGSMHLWNVGKLLPDYTAYYPRRQSSLYSSPWEPEISPSRLFYGFSPLIHETVNPDCDEYESGAHRELAKVDWWASFCVGNTWILE
jgi:hypothetical protein